MALFLASQPSSDPGFLYIGAGVIGFCGVSLIISGIKFYRKSQTLKRTPIVPVNRASAGLVHVRGKASGEDRLTSFFTKVPCYYFEAKVMKHSTFSSGGPEWREIAKETENRPFYVDDGTGRVLVNHQGAEYELAESFRTQLDKPKSRYVDPSLGVAGPTDHELQALVEARWGKGKYQFSEICLPAERECSVLGLYAQNPAPKDAADRNIIMQGQKEDPFLVSSKSEEQEEKALRKKAWGLMATGLTAIGLAVLCGLMAAGFFFPV